MRKRGRILCFLMSAALCASFASAHPGRTDAQGGHYNRSTGEYHFHHGYPAHQHPNGVCPYDFDDQTGKSNGSSEEKRTVEVEPEDQTQEKPDTLSTGSKIALVVAIVIIISLYVGPVFLITWILWEKFKKTFSEQPRNTIKAVTFFILFLGAVGISIYGLYFIWPFK